MYSKLKKFCEISQKFYFLGRESKSHFSSKLIYWHRAEQRLDSGMAEKRFADSFQLLVAQQEDSNWYVRIVHGGTLLLLWHLVNICLSTIFDVTWPLSGGNWNLCTTFIIFCAMNQFRKGGKSWFFFIEGAKQNYHFSDRNYHFLLTNVCPFLSNSRELIVPFEILITPRMKYKIGIILVKISIMV